MLGIDLEQTRVEMLEDLKLRAEQLMEKLGQGDMVGASDVIRGINEARDRSLYREVGKLTRGLHQAIVNFQIEADADRLDATTQSEMANAQDRLGYVLSKTQAAADKTMDMVEAGIPLASGLADDAGRLKADWERLSRREMNPAEFRELYKRIDDFLGSTQSQARTLSDQFNNILIAQDYQDLTGQVIKKVMSLVKEVEDNLVHLMRIAGTVEELTGLVQAPTKQDAENNSIAAEGPVVNADKRSDVVKGQDDVDDLLSSLGF